MSGTSLSSDARTVEEEGSKLKRTLGDGKSGPTALSTSRREINLHYLREILYLNMAKRIRTFEVEVRTILSIYGICLCVILNDIHVAQGTETEDNVPHVMDCVRRCHE